MRRLIARLRFRHLHLLLELHRGGSLRAAASVLNLTQPALSKALAEIEGTFGFALFTRSARGMAPTPRGEIAIRGASLLLAELAHVGVEASAEPATTLLRIGAPPFVALAYLPEVLSKLLSGGRIRVLLMEDRVPLLVQSLLNGELDALVTSLPAQMLEAAEQRLHYEKLFEADFAVIAPPEHPLGRACIVDWQRLSRERWIMPMGTSMVRHLIDDVFRREGLIAPSPVIESTNPVTNLHLVASGLGISAVPGATLRIAGAAGLVQRLRAEPPIPSAPVALIHRSKPLNPRVTLLRSALGLD